MPGRLVLMRQIENAVDGRQLGYLICVTKKSPE
jgi:hypothetical protein